jgi:hypothetical protein
MFHVVSYCALAHADLLTRTRIGARIRLSALAHAHLFTRTRLRALAYAHSLSRTRLRALAYEHSLTRTRLRALAYARALAYRTRLRALSHVHSFTRTPTVLFFRCFMLVLHTYIKVKAPRLTLISLDNFRLQATR